jgi:hypothetical protein
VRTAFILLVCLLLAGVASAVVKVEPIVPIECSRNVRVSVFLEGKTIPGVEVDLYDGASATKRPIFSARTNMDGPVRPPVLAAGTYRVDARFQQDRITLGNDEVTTLIWLRVTPKSQVRTAVIDLTDSLHNAREYAKQFEARLSEAVQGHRAHLRAFEGTVRDPLGTLIPSAKVSIFQSTSKGWAIRLRTTSDPSGYFSSKTLNQGRYVGLFSAEGCRLAMVPFEIGDESSGKLRVKLSIGFTDVSVPQDSSRIATTDNWQLITDN